VSSKLVEWRFLKFCFKEVMLSCLTLYLRCYAARLLFCVVSHSLVLVML
jgi:hypothetical protein